MVLFSSHSDPWCVFSLSLVSFFCTYSVCVLVAVLCFVWGNGSAIRHCV